jgi:beta-lactamase regulating signal transducer with metallopeptidase domain
MLEGIFANLIETTLSVSVVVLLLLLLAKILDKKYAAKWKYWVWLVLAIRLLIPFNMTLADPPIQLKASDITKTWTTTATDISTSSIFSTALKTWQTTNSLDSAASEASNDNTRILKTFISDAFDLTQFLMILWLAGAFFLIVYYLITYGLFREKIKRWCSVVQLQNELDVYATVCQEMKIHRQIPLMTCKLIRSPMVIGIFKQILLLPEMTFSSRQLKMILHHELVHVRRRDILYKCLIFTVRIVHWFNPFVHLMAAEANKEVEISCDAEVTLNQNSNFRKEYCNAILEAVHNGLGPNAVFSTNFGDGKAMLMKRFESLFDIRRKKKGILSFIIIVLIIGIIGICISCDQKPAITINTSSKTSENISSKISGLAFTNLKAISAGALHIIGLKNDGTVVACFSISPVAEGQFDISNWKDIVSVAAGGEVWAYSLLTVGLKKDGTVISTDLNGHSFDVSSWKDITAISAGAWTIIGLRKDGTVVEAGLDEQYVNGVSSWKDINAVSAGAVHEVGLKKDGTVVAHGDNLHHECDVSTWTDIIAVSAGGEYTIGLKKDGTLVAVGNNQFGACDVSSWTNIIAISAGNRYAVGLKSDGTVVTTRGGPDLSGWYDISAVSASRATAGLKKDETVIIR